MAAAAVMLVIPVYVYRNRELHDLVIFGELLAVAAIVMCLLFVTVDLGRPDRFLHLFLRFNFPISMLTWDVIVLNGYLLLNLHICGYLIYCAYMRSASRRRKFYIPFVFLAIVWAISIHTVTAFLYVGLGGRPFWNSAIIAPRFLASAFAAGPAFLILSRCSVIDKFTGYDVPAKALDTAAEHRDGRADHQHVPARLRGVHGASTPTRRTASPLKLPVLRPARLRRAGALDLDRHRAQHASR